MPRWRSFRQCFSSVFGEASESDGSAEGFPDEWPRDGDVREAVFGVVGHEAHAPGRQVA